MMGDLGEVEYQLSTTPYCWYNLVPGRTVRLVRGELSAVITMMKNRTQFKN